MYTKLKDINANYVQNFLNSLENVILSLTLKNNMQV